MGQYDYLDVRGSASPINIFRKLIILFFFGVEPKNICYRAINSEFKTEKSINEKFELKIRRNSLYAVLTFH